MILAARLRQGLSSWGRRSATGASRFPVALLAVAAFSILSNALAAGRNPATFDIGRLLTALGCAGAVSVAVTLFLAARRVRPTVRHATALPFALLAAMIVYTSQPFAVNATMLLAAALLAVPLAPFVGRGTSGEFWTFSLAVSLGIGLAFLTVILFCLGMQVVVEMVRYLFDLGRGRRFDGHLVITALTFVGPLFALGRIPDPTQPLAVPDGRDNLTLAVRALLEWVQLPLVLVAALVLHAYAARIGISGVVPRNQTGWIVGVYSLMLLQLRVALDPFRQTGSAPSRWFLRFWPWLLVVPLVLLAHALWQRVASEGFTLPRYALGVWTLFAVLAVAAQLVPRLRGDIRFLVALPAVLLVLATAGPLGVSATVGRSQAARIEARFAATEGRSRAITEEDVAWLTSRLRALDAVGELGRVRPIVAAIVPDARIAPGADLSTMLASLVESDVVAAPSRTFVADASVPLAVSGYDLAFPSRQLSSGGTFVEIAGRTLLRIRWNGHDDRIDLANAIGTLPFRERGSDPLRLDAAPQFEVASEAGRRVGVRIERLTVGRDGALADAEVTLLLRSDDWTP